MNFASTPHSIIAPRIFLPNSRQPARPVSNVYFENAGGAVWQAVLPLLNQFARVPVCGLIAQYNGVSAEDQNDTVAATMREVLSKSLTLRGFINYDFLEYFPDFLAEVGDALRDGTIKYREDIVLGIENAPEA